MSCLACNGTTDQQSEQTADPTINLESEVEQIGDSGEPVPIEQDVRAANLSAFPILDGGNVRAIRLKFGHSYSEAKLAAIWSDAEKKDLSGADISELVELKVSPNVNGKIFNEIFLNNINRNSI